jgi:hypothetical protein
MPEAYLSPEYLATLRFWGEPLPLQHSGGWLLERALGSHASDLCGPYPVFRCPRPTALAADLAVLAEDPRRVALVLIWDALDPLPPQPEKLFPDLWRVLRPHYLVDLRAALSISAHHRYYARRARRALEIVRLEAPAQASADWTRLYAELSARHAITGLRRFSAESFAALLQLPELVAFAARQGEETVAISLWLHDQERAYSHLSASSARGYALSATYALYQFALEWFQQQGLHWLDLGGAPRGAQGGLAAFKAGWSSRCQPVWIGGRIFQPERYAQLSAGFGGDYFPRYRSGEQGA